MALKLHCILTLSTTTMVHDCGQDVSIMEEQLTLYANVTDELLEEFKSDDDSDGILMSA